MERFPSVQLSTGATRSCEMLCEPVEPLKAHMMRKWRGGHCYFTSIVDGEYAENELRKDFTKTERVAIAIAVEEELRKRERRGNPDLKKSNDSSIPVPEPQLETGQKTRDLAAQKVGWSGRTFEQAKKVVAHMGRPICVDPPTLRKTHQE